jgi:hypothetical protein
MSVSNDCTMCEYYCSLIKIKHVMYMQYEMPTYVGVNVVEIFSQFQIHVNTMLQITLVYFNQID